MYAFSMLCRRMYTRNLFLAGNARLCSNLWVIYAVKEATKMVVSREINIELHLV